MSLELTVLGTASQAPTRERSQGGYVLRWEDEYLLFDPGEGCQRQLLKAGLSAARITHTFLTHFHGDHCLGLAGFVQARALSGTSRRLALHYWRRREPMVDHLLAGCEIDFDLGLDRRPTEPASLDRTKHFLVSSLPLDHTVPTLGWRLVGPARRHLLPERLRALGIEKEHIGLLEQDATLDLPDGRVVRVEEVSEVRTGPTVAFIMDTRLCDNAIELAAGADLVICEATYLDSERELAVDHGHMTAADAATVARDAGAAMLVLSHFSNRYPDETAFAVEAAEVFVNVVAARDLEVISAPAGRGGG